MMIANSTAVTIGKVNELVCSAGIVNDVGRSARNVFADVSAGVVVSV